MPQFPTPYIRTELVEFYKLFNLTSSEIAEVDAIYAAAFTFMRICGTALLVIGIPGNLAVVVVLRGRSMRRNLTALFLTYLAAFNLLNLVVGLTRYVVVSFRGPDIRLYSQTLCALHKNIIVFGHLAVNWTILAVALCKMAYILVPDTLMKNLPKSFVHSVMLTMCVYGYSIVLVLATFNIELDTESSFHLLKCEQDYLTVPSLLQMSCTFVLPEIFMCLVNIFTIRAYYRIWRTATPSEKQMVTVNYIMGIMLFVSDIQLMLTEIPYILINTFKPLVFPVTPKGAAHYLLACYLSVGALYSNYALNCLTYCFFGGHFRRELRRFLRPLLRMLCDPASRWVSSEASIFDDEEHRSFSDTIHRLSLNLILENDLEQFDSDYEDEEDVESLVQSNEENTNGSNFTAAGSGSLKAHASSMRGGNLGRYPMHSEVPASRHNQLAGNTEHHSGKKRRRAASVLSPSETPGYSADTPAAAGWRGKSSLRSNSSSGSGRTAGRLQQLRRDSRFRCGLAGVSIKSEDYWDFT